MSEPGSSLAAQVLLAASAIAIGTLVWLAWVYAVEPWLYPDLIC